VGFVVCDKAVNFLIGGFDLFVCVTGGFDFLICVAGGWKVCLYNVMMVFIFMVIWAALSDLLLKLTTLPAMFCVS